MVAGDLNFTSLQGTEGDLIHIMWSKFISEVELAMNEF